MASSNVDVILIPEFHHTAGRKILHLLIPFLQEIITSKHDIKRILNVSEGKGVPSADVSFFEALYAPEKGFIHIFEWDERSPDVAYIECVKFVLTVITIVHGNLGIAWNVAKEGKDVKSFKGFQGIEGRNPPKNYIELVYTQMYEGQKFVPVEDVLCKELSEAFRDIYDGNKSEEVFNEHINKALGRLLEILDEKDCKNKDTLKSIVGAILAGGNVEGRDVPIEKARATIRELNDERFIEQIERYVSEHPEITHVIMNIGASHYKNTIRLIAKSRNLVFNKDIDHVVKYVYDEVGVGDMFKGGNRKTKSRKNTQHRKRHTRRRSKN